MTRVHVVGASGYAAAEVIRLLMRHPEFELGVLESSSHAAEKIGRVFPYLRELDRCFEDAGSVIDRAARGEAVVLAGAHGAAKSIAPLLLERGVRVVDLSGDYRLAPSPAVYGYAPLYRDRIAGATFVANPGCYPTAALLATLPLAPLVPKQIIVDAKSGITGAGRTPAVGSLYAEVEGEVRAYGLGGHRHEPEILEQWRSANIFATLLFTPQVVPLARGMLVCAYASCAQPPDQQAAIEAYRLAYANDATVRIVDEAPSLRAVCGSGDAELHVSVHGSTVRAICAIDNLGRGAAAQALVNLNIMYGYPDDTGVSHARLVA